MPTSSLTIYQHNSGYRYNSDTIVLYSFIHSFACKGNILEVGFGSGILSLLIKRDFPKSNVVGIDVQKQNLELAKYNAKLNNLAVDFICDDFSNFFTQKFDIIISNPPYYHVGVQRSSHEQLAKSRYSVYLPLEVFAKNISLSLKSGGRVFFCYDAKQIALVLDVLRQNKLTPEFIQFVHTKRAKEASIVLINAKKNSKSLAKIIPPFVLHENSGYTLEAKRAYEIANVVSEELKNGTNN